MKGYYAIYNHRSNQWLSQGGTWMEDTDTYKDVNNVRTFSTLSEAESFLVGGSVYKNDYRDFFTIRKIYF